MPNPILNRRHILLPRKGRLNQFSLNFDGNDECINTDSLITPLAPTTKGAWSAWVELDDATPASNQTIIGFGDTDARAYVHVVQLPSGLTLFAAASIARIEWVVQTDSQVLTSGGRHKVCVVQPGDGTDPEIFIDGTKPAQTTTNNTDLSFWFSDFTALDNGRIGCLNTNSGGDINHLSGKLDEIVYFDDALTLAEDDELYNEGNAINPLSHSKSANVVAWYRMGDGDDNFNDGVANEWQLIDATGNGYNAQSVNMEEGDRVRV